MLSKVERNRIAHLHCSAGRSITDLNALLDGLHQVIVSGDEYIIHLDGKVKSFIVNDKEIVQQFIQLYSINCSVILTLQDDITVWEEVGFVIDKLKYGFLNEEVVDVSRIRIPMKYDGIIDTYVSISMNHKIISEHKRQIGVRRHDNQHIPNVSKYFPAMSGAKKHLLHDTVANIQKMIPTDGSMMDINKIISALRK